MTQTIEIETNDKKVFPIPIQIGNLLGYFKNYVEEFSDDQNVHITLENISGPIFSKLLEFANHYSHLPSAMTTEESLKFRQTPDMDVWDENYCKIDQKALFDVIEAANFLNYPRCLDVTCKSVANAIRHKSVQEIRDLFGITGDLSVEEEQQLMEEQAFLSEKT